MYETYRPGAENPYTSGFVQETRWVSDDGAESDDELEQLQDEIINDEPDTPDETQGLVNNPSYIDSDDWEDTVEHRDSGIRDIVITGTVRFTFISYPPLIRACVPISIGMWSPTPGVSTPCHAPIVSRTKSLGIIRRVNTDYLHGDCPLDPFGAMYR